ncbi:MAG: DUF4465 domain-containing protein [Pirellulaceae bacterium]|nr:DUF4465 domain-containing protein [Pirellulaceae bacterium]
MLTRFRLYWLCCAFMLTWLAEPLRAAEIVLDFEQYNLPSDQYIYWPDLEHVSFETTLPWGPNYAVSRKRSLTDPIFYWANGDDTTVTIGGAGGSEQWLTVLAAVPGEIILIAPANTRFGSVKITNAALVDYTVRYGLYQASQFGPNDYLRVRFLALNADDTPTGAATDWIDLATFTASLSTLDEWIDVDLSGLQSDRMTIEMAGTDNDPIWGLNTPAYLALDDLIIHPADPPTTIVNSFVYHSAWSGPSSGPWDALDTSKTLAPSGPQAQTLGLENLINTIHGINGLVFDFDRLPDPSGLTVSDFMFKMSPQGAFDLALNPPESWPSVPVFPTVSVSEITSFDRALLQWPNQIIENRWLQVTVLANSNTGLAQDAVYYIGHLRGETTGPASGVYTVSFADISFIRESIGLTVFANGATDIDKNGVLAFADISAMRAHISSQLSNLTVP